MLHVQQRSVVLELVFVDGHLGSPFLRLVPVETLVTDPLTPKERMSVMVFDVPFAVRGFLERRFEDGEFGAEDDGEDGGGGRGGKSSSAGIFRSSSLLFVSK